MNNNNSNNNNNNNTVQTHQKSFKRSNSNTNTNLAANGGHLPQGSMAASGSHSFNSGVKDHQPRAGFVANDHPQQRNFRHRNGGGPHQRGDGHHHNYGGRRDQDRNQDWNNHRNFHGRDNYMSPRFGPRFMRPPNPAQLYQSPPPPPPSLRPYGSIGFPGM